MPETKDIGSGQIIIYKDPKGPELKLRLEGDTIWMTQSQLSDLFQTDRTSITRHLNNIIDSGELREKSNVQFLHIAGSDRPVKVYNLDFIIAVGYRVNSKRATQFRVWATSKLRELLLKGYVVSEARLKARQASRLKELEKTVTLFQKVLNSNRLEGYEKDLLKIITDYTHTWLLLSNYDSSSLVSVKSSKKNLKPLDYLKVKQAIDQFKSRLMKNKQAEPSFGVEEDSKLEILLADPHLKDLKNSFATVEEKAAQLFYSAVKNQPFSDGNKRIGALLFLLYLVENNSLYNKKGERKINDAALAALALLISESDPENKDLLVKLIANLLVI